jgi:hypothetical protein
MNIACHSQTLQEQICPLDLGANERKRLKYHPLVRIGMVAQLVASLINGMSDFRVLHDALTQHEEGGFDLVPVKDFKNSARVERVRAVVEGQCDDSVGRFDPLIGFTEKLVIR